MPRRPRRSSPSRRSLLGWSESGSPGASSPRRTGPWCSRCGRSGRSRRCFGRCRHEGPAGRRAGPPRAGVAGVLRRLLGVRVMTVDLAPGSQAWASRVSPSKLAAIRGVSPWESPRSLWHKMRGDVPWGETNVDQERGHLLEAGVLEWWRRRHPAHTDWADQPSFTPAEWLVATPDAICTDSAERVLVEAKTSADYDAFGEPGTDEIPTYYLTQVYFAAHLAVLAGEPITRIYVPLLGPRLRFEEYVVEYDPEIGQQLMATAERWRDMLLTDEAPDLDDTVATFDVMRKLHPEIERGTEVKVALEVGRALDL